MSNLELLTTGDGSHTLFNSDLNETYHSRHGAVQESRHVFLKNGLNYWFEKSNSGICKILEIGFGTGLNAWLTCLGSTQIERTIYYTSLEPFPLPDLLVEQLNYTSDSSNNDQDVFKFLHKAEWEVASQINPFFIFEKTNQKLQEFQKTGFDVIYFDAFAPDKQPELWIPDIFSKLYHLLNQNGILVTYCAKGQFKRDLKSAGFQIETLTGPPGKKEMVRGIKSSS